jgi:hypothetical protein
MLFRFLTTIDCDTAIVKTLHTFATADPLHSDLQCLDLLQEYHGLKSFFLLGGYRVRLDVGSFKRATEALARLLGLGGRLLRLLRLLQNSIYQHI